MKKVYTALEVIFGVVYSLSPILTSAWTGNWWYLLLYFLLPIPLAVLVGRSIVKIINEDNQHECTCKG